MYKQNCYTLKTIDQLPKKARQVLLDNIDADLIRLLTECVVNLLLGNLKGISKQQASKHLNIIEAIHSKRHKRYRKEQRKLFKSDKGLALLQMITPVIITHFS